MCKDGAINLLRNADFLWKQWNITENKNLYQNGRRNYKWLYGDTEIEQTKIPPLQKGYF